MKKNISKIIKKIINEQNELTIKGQKVPLEIVKTISDTETGGLSRVYKDAQFTKQIAKQKIDAIKKPIKLPEPKLGDTTLYDTFISTNEIRKKEFSLWLQNKNVGLKDKNNPTDKELQYWFSINDNKYGEEYLNTLNNYEKKRWEKWKKNELSKIKRFYIKYTNATLLKNLDNIDSNSDSQQISMYRGSGAAFLLSNLTDFVSNIFDKIGRNFAEEEKAIEKSTSAIADQAAKDLGFDIASDKKFNPFANMTGSFNNNFFPSLNLGGVSAPVQRPGLLGNYPYLVNSFGIWQQVNQDGTLTKPSGYLSGKVNDPFGVIYGKDKRKILKWVEYSLITTTGRSEKEFYDLFNNSFDIYLSASTYRKSIAYEMGWTKPSDIMLNILNLESLSKLSRTTCVDTSYIIGVEILNTLQDIFKEKILRTFDELSNSKEYKDKTGKDLLSVLSKVFFLDVGVYEGQQIQKYGELCDLIEGLNTHNRQILLQQPSREKNPENPKPDKESNIGSCKKQGTITYDGKPLTYFYNMKNVCKNYGGLWLDGPTSAKRCCCADLPNKKTIVKIKPTNGYRTIKAASNVYTEPVAFFPDVHVNLTKSCEKVTDVRTFGEKVSDTIEGCKTDYHCWLDLASVASLVIPGYGLIISFVIDSVNAVTYLVEAGLADSNEDRNAALLGAGFSFMGASMGGGLGLSKNLIKGYPKSVVTFGQDFTKITYEVYGKGANKALSAAEKEEIEMAWDMLVKKHGLNKAETRLAGNYLKQVQSLETQFLRKYTSSLTELRSKIGASNLKKIGGEKKFIELLGQEKGDVIKALDKYMKTSAGREFLQELGLFTLMSYKMPEIIQSLTTTAAETGTRPVVGGKAALSTMVQVSGFDLKTAQDDFGSDRTAYDNGVMRRAWLDGWRPGYDILTVDMEDFETQFQNQKNNPKIKITPKFIQNKDFGKYATANLKKRLVDSAMEEMEKKYRETLSKQTRQIVDYVDDEKFGEATRYTDHTIVKKSDKKYYENVKKKNKTEKVNSNDFDDIDRRLKEKGL
jgi:hypothetical protein